MHALPQRNDDGLAAIVEFFAFRQHRLGLVVRVDGVERLEDVHADDEAYARGRQHNVERRWLAHRRIAHRPARRVGMRCR